MSLAKRPRKVIQLYKDNNNTFSSSNNYTMQDPNTMQYLTQGEGNISSQRVIDYVPDHNAA